LTLSNHDFDLLIERGSFFEQIVLCVAVYLEPNSGSLQKPIEGRGFAKIDRGDSRYWRRKPQKHVKNYVKEDHRKNYTSVPPAISDNKKAHFVTKSYQFVFSVV
jgi:hypothetical protein